jgi:hypothetical protein
MSISRSTTPSRATAAAFDFDVVSDLPPRPSRKPDPAPEGTHPESAPRHAKAEAAEN